MRVLIFGTMYIKDERGLLSVNSWYECWKRYNSRHDFLLIDSHSEEKWIKKLSFPTKRKKMHDDDIFRLQINDKENVISFSDNIGHLLSTGRDGWGRAFCAGITNAIYNGYDYAVHIESDLLFKGNVSAVVDEMHEISIPVVGTKSWLYGFLETGLLFMNVQFLKAVKFLSRYTWKSYASNWRISAADYS